MIALAIALQVAGQSPPPIGADELRSRLVESGEGISAGKTLGQQRNMLAVRRRAAEQVATRIEAGDCAGAVTYARSAKDWAMADNAARLCAPSPGR